MTYECDKCAACCRQLIIEIGWIDVLREPKIREVAKPFKIPEGMVVTDARGKPIESQDPYIDGAMLACGSTFPCPFVGTDNLCSIYPTRPNDCVAFEAGDEQCQEARAMAGLEPLKPVEVGG